MVELLEGRLQMYTTAAENARAAGDTSKQRRLDRGAKVCAKVVLTDFLIYSLTMNFMENLNFLINSIPSNNLP